MDTLSKIVLLSQEHLTQHVSLAQYKLTMSRLMLELNDNEALSLASLIEQYAIHLRSGGH